MKRTNVMGKFVPKNKHKFDGSSCIYRSLWERKVMLYCDRSPSVVRWSSERIAIKYWNSKTAKYHTYYPDFCIEYIDKNCFVQKVIVEVKPHSQKRWQINLDKWAYAAEWCDQNGYDFKVLTEKEIKP